MWHHDPSSVCSPNTKSHSWALVRYKRVPGLCLNHLSAECDIMTLSNLGLAQFLVQHISWPSIISGPAPFLAQHCSCRLTHCIHAQRNTYTVYSIPVLLPMCNSAPSLHHWAPYVHLICTLYAQCTSLYTSQYTSQCTSQCTSQNTSQCTSHYTYYMYAI